MIRKLGRRPRSFRPEIPHYSALRLMRAPDPIPASKSWLVGMPDDLGFMLNQDLGDCTCAGLGHARQVWTFNTTGHMVTVPDADVAALYERACGYVPGDASTDQGGNEQDLLAYCVRTGIPTENGPDHLLGFYEVDARNLDDVRRAIYETGLAYIGISIPEAWSQAQAGDTWDATDSPVEGGHCVILAGYDPAGFDVVSWGMRFRLTDAGFKQACDEAYALVDRSWINATGATPAGLTVAELEQQMSALA